MYLLVTTKLRCCRRNRGNLKEKKCNYHLWDSRLSSSDNGSVHLTWAGNKESYLNLPRNQKFGQKNMENIIIGVLPPPLFFFFLNMSYGIDKHFREICITMLLHWSEDLRKVAGEKKQQKNGELGNRQFFFFLQKA